MCHVHNVTIQRDRLSMYKLQCQPRRRHDRVRYLGITQISSIMKNQHRMKYTSDRSRAPRRT